ncbi:MAG: hypothetical protein ACPGVB_07265, partial [Chitinophagales bacterium]
MKENSQGKFVVMVFLEIFAGRSEILIILKPIMKYKSFTNFKKKLGQYNLVINSNELSNLDFLDNVGGIEDIKHLNDKYSLHIYSERFVNIVTKMPYLYIVSAYQQSEIFFQQFKKELQPYAHQISPSRLLMFYFNFAQSNYFSK